MSSAGSEKPKPPTRTSAVAVRLIRSTSSSAPVAGDTPRSYDRVTRSPSGTPGTMRCPAGVAFSSAVMSSDANTVTPSAGSGVAGTAPPAYADPYSAHALALVVASGCTRSVTSPSWWQPG